AGNACRRSADRADQHPDRARGSGGGGAAASGSGLSRGCGAHRNRHAMGPHHRRRHGPLVRDAHSDPPGGANPTAATVSPPHLSPASLDVAAINRFGGPDAVWTVSYTTYG